jgi:hypothetical protein
VGLGLVRLLCGNVISMRSSDTTLLSLDGLASILRVHPKSATDVSSTGALAKVAALAQLENELGDKVSVRPPRRPHDERLDSNSERLVQGGAGARSSTGLSEVRLRFVRQSATSERSFDSRDKS